MVDGASGSFAKSNSLSPGGRPVEVSTIGSIIDSGTMLTTISPFARMLTSVSLGLGWPRASRPAPPTEKPRIGGSGEQTLKKLYGARLLRPSRSIVDTQAIGRGMIASRSSRYISFDVSDAGFSSTVGGGWSGDRSMSGVARSVAEAATVPEPRRGRRAPARTPTRPGTRLACRGRATAVADRWGRSAIQCARWHHTKAGKP